MSDGMLSQALAEVSGILKGMGQKEGFTFSRAMLRFMLAGKCSGPARSSWPAAAGLTWAPGWPLRRG